jgi:signal transduction histidine kinase
VNRAEADMVARIDANATAYAASRRVVIGFAFGTIALALLLGYVISWSLIDPVRRMDRRLREIASGDFSHHIEVPNRDELGALAANLNRMNDELQQVYRQLAAASEHKSRFLASMSHELRTPLNAVLGYTELIIDGIYGESPPQIREVLERIQHSGRHLLGLINDVLDLSKIETGQLTLVMQEYSLPDLVRAAMTAVESLAAERHLTLSADLAPELPRGRGDPRRLTQVLLNLVGNAIKFTEEGEVRIRASAADGQFVVAVVDTGPGIPEADQRRIFEEFQQADAGGGRSKGGTGLGLAIARRIVELHGGRMGVESQTGAGATFWFEVPVRADRGAGAT